MDVTSAVLAAAVTLGALAPSDPVSTSEAGQIPAPAGVTMAADTPVDQGPVIRKASLNLAPSSRPAPLVPLYTSLVVLQGLDIYTTSVAMSRGAVEANPGMKPVAGKTWASVAVKAAATAGSVYFIERAWKHNRKGAVVLATVINVATAAVVAHNTQASRR